MGVVSILELLHHIVSEPALRLLPQGRFPKADGEFVDMVFIEGS